MKFVELSGLDPFCFVKIVIVAGCLRRTLNRIQSKIYHTAFNSNENLLVCAPTGAGKTNIAMVAVLRELASNMRAGVIQKADFKIVYVAPMKALAAEVTATFSRRLAALGAPPRSDALALHAVNTVNAKLLALLGSASPALCLWQPYLMYISA